MGEAKEDYTQVKKEDVPQLHDVLEIECYFHAKVLRG